MQYPNSLIEAQFPLATPEPLELLSGLMAQVSFYSSGSLFVNALSFGLATSAQT